MPLSIAPGSQSELLSRRHTTQAAHRPSVRRVPLIHRPPGSHRAPRDGHTTRHGAPHGLRAVPLIIDDVPAKATFRTEGHTTRLRNDRDLPRVPLIAGATAGHRLCPTDGRRPCVDRQILHAPSRETGHRQRRRDAARHDRPRPAPVLVPRGPPVAALVALRSRSTPDRPTAGDKSVDTCLRGVDGARATRASRTLSTGHAEPSPDPGTPAAGAPHGSRPSDLRGRRCSTAPTGPTVTAVISL